MYRTDFWTLWDKVRVGCFERTASKHVYYLGWNRSPAQVGCMRQVLRPGALGRPRGIGWRGRWEGGSGWGTHVNPWLIHFNLWQNPLQYCTVICLPVIKKNFFFKRRLKWKWDEDYLWDTWWYLWYFSLPDLNIHILILMLQWSERGVCISHLQLRERYLKVWSLRQFVLCPQKLV